MSINLLMLRLTIDGLGGFACVLIPWFLSGLEKYFFANFESGKVWKKIFLVCYNGKRKKISRPVFLTYIFLIFYSRLISFYLYRVKYYSACN